MDTYIHDTIDFACWLKYLLSVAVTQFFNFQIPNRLLKLWSVVGLCPIFDWGSTWGEFDTANRDLIRNSRGLIF